MTPVTVLVGIVVALVVVAVAQHLRRRREAAGGSGIEGSQDFELTPVPGVTPGELGTVLFGETKYDQVSATVIDLAERGHLHARALPSAVDGVAVSWLLEFTPGHDSLCAGRYRLS